MNQTTVRNILFAVFGAGAVVMLFFNPFASTGDQKVQRLPVDKARADALVAALPEFSQPALEATLGLWKDTDLVIAGEYGFIKEEADFATALIARLPEAGVSVVGLDTLLAEDQPALDQLMAAPAFDDRAFINLLAKRHPMRISRQYLDEIKTTWQTNQTSRAAGGPGLRLVALNISWDTALAAERGDSLDGPTIKRIFNQGLYDEAYARILGAEVLEAGRKGFALLWRESAFTGFAEPNYAASIKAYGFGDPRRAGRILHDAYGPRVGNIVFHTPWQNPDLSNGIGYPASGVVDAVLDKLPQDKTPAWPLAIDLRTGPFKASPVVDSSYVQAREFKFGGTTYPKGPRQDLTLGDFGSLYIVLGRLDQLSVYEALPDAIGPDNLALVAKFLPAQDPARNDAGQLNRQIAENFQRFKLTFSQFKR